MSASRILGQSVPCLLNAFPGWKQPTHLKMVATISSGVATMVADQTTPGVELAQIATGNYTLSFPACRKVGSFNGNVTPATATTVGNHRKVNFGYVGSADANATGGSIVVQTITFEATPAITAPNDGSRVDIDFWADLG
jgi:hypothetical protein